MRRLPPLNALRAFEAAGRHQSFTRAADELHVTHGAVSRHVRLLEQHLGVALFRRQAHGVELTGRGRALLPELTASFERISVAARKVADAGCEIRVVTQPSLAARLLVPRLGHFHDLHPGVRVSVGLFLVGYEEFHRGGFDVGLGCHENERGRPEGVESVLLRRGALAPVCAPALLGGDPPLRGPSDLARHVLLHPTPDREDWRTWLRAAGLAEAAAEGGHTFDTMEMAVGAAAGGLGVAIADLHLYQDELSSGRLAAPFGPVLSDGTGYYLFTERGRFGEPKVAALRDWLLAELAAAGGGVGRSAPPLSSPA